jgi:hypothetical protein
MPSYEFKCGYCRTTQTEFAREPVPVCLICKRPLDRRFSFNIGKVFDPHFNNTTGTYVSNRREFVDDLHRLSDRQSERLGIEHNYVPIDPGEDPSAFGVTDELPHAFAEKMHRMANE